MGLQGCRSNNARDAILCVVSLWIVLAVASPTAIAGDNRRVDLAETGRLYESGIDRFPDTAQEIEPFLAQLKPTKSASLFGGAYWLYGEVRHSDATNEWIFDPNNTLIDCVEARIFAPDGSVQRIVTGYRSDHQYMLHYGKSVRLQPNTDYRVLVKFSSPYFASNPRFEVLPETDYRDAVLKDNIWIIGCLGAVVALALFNLMLFASTLDKGALYYALYLITFGTGWAFVFHIPAHMFGLRNLSLHYIPFFLMPVTSALFCLDFLKLRENFPRLAKLCVTAIIICLALLPINFFAQKYAHTVATIVISFWLPLATKGKGLA